MNLEHVAATAFLAELEFIASSDVSVGTKTAAIALFNEMSVEDVEGFLKEAGLMGGLYQAGAGALKGGLNVAKGAGQGVLNAAKGVGQGIAGRARAMGAAVKAAPGNLGNSLSNMGARLETAGASMGNRLAQGGANMGQRASARLAGPGGGALNDIATSLKANAPAPAAPTMGNTLDKLQKSQGSEMAPMAMGKPAGSVVPPAAAPGAPSPLKVPSQSPRPMTMMPPLPAAQPAGEVAPPPASGTRLKSGPTYGARAA